MKKGVWEAMSDKTRREIVWLLKSRPYTAGEIADQFSLAPATVSHHLSVLRESKLVTVTRRAQTLIYSLDVRQLRGLRREIEEIIE